MKHAFNRLGFQIGFGVTLLLCGLAAALFFVLFNQSKTALVDAAETRQAMSIKILVNEMAHYQDFEVTTDANGEVSGLTAQSIIAFENHDMIDRVGSISGETATIFVWDDAEQDFVRRTTNIIKDDGARAVGTVLGKANPVYASMMKGEVFRGQATILGKDYFTIYVPVLSEAGEPLGIFYVGVAKEALTVAINEMLVEGGVIAVLGLLVAMGLTVIALRYMLRPIQSLEVAVTAIRDEDYDTVVPFTNRPDGIGGGHAVLSSSAKNSQMLWKMSTAPKSNACDRTRQLRGFRKGSAVWLAATCLIASAKIPAFPKNMRGCAKISMRLQKTLLRRWERSQPWPKTSAALQAKWKWYLLICRAV